MNKFEAGDIVILKLDDESYRNAPLGLRKRNGCRMVVMDLHKVSGKNAHAYYELQSCKSEYGISYAIMEEWLLPTR